MTNKVKSNRPQQTTCYRVRTKLRAGMDVCPKAFDDNVRDMMKKDGKTCKWIPAEYNYRCF